MGCHEKEILPKTSNKYFCDVTQVNMYSCLTKCYKSGALYGTFEIVDLREE